MTEANDATNGEPVPTDAVADEGHVDLPSGEPFGASSLGDVLRQVPARLIVVGGTQKSGKTTLIASIYERYRRGRFADMMFCGSRTLVGFEMICHLGRQQSGRTMPETERTPRPLGWQVFHLGLADPRCRWDLLLADMSGEAYEQVRDFADEGGDMSLLRRADQFVLLMDGAKLCDVRERHSVYDDSHTILRRLLESKQLSPETPVTLVFSKWDVVERMGTETDAKPFCEQIEAKMRTCFGPVLRCLSFGRAIARDDRDNGRPATLGVAELLRCWCDEERPAVARASSSMPPTRRWVDRYELASNG